MFSMKVFICGFKYIKSRHYKSQLILFFCWGKQKWQFMSLEIDMNINKGLVAVFSKLVQSRILIDLFYHKSIHDLLMFGTICCLNVIIWEAVEEELCFSFLLR